MDFEKEAATHGWVPEEKWKGPSDKWVDAETFVKRGENILPIMSERLHTLTEKHDSLKSELEQIRSVNDGLKSSLQKFNENYAKTLETERARIVRELKVQRKEALSNDDIETADKLNDEIAKVKSEPVINDPTPTQQPARNPHFEPWLAENDWYLKDRELSDYADFVGQKINGTITGKEFFDEVSKRVKQTFPEKFNGGGGHPHSAVDSGLPTGAVEQKSKKFSYRDLPQDAKAACDSMVKDGDLSREDYVKFYFGGA